MARWPRSQPLDYSNMTWAGVVASNYLSIVFTVMLFVLLYALAPDMFVAIIKIYKEL